jgi:hypothetical protein
MCNVSCSIQPCDGFNITWYSLVISPSLFYFTLLSLHCHIMYFTVVGLDQVEFFVIFVLVMLS